MLLLQLCTQTRMSECYKFETGITLKSPNSVITTDLQIRYNSAIAKANCWWQLINSFRVTVLMSVLFSFTYHFGGKAINGMFYGLLLFNCWWRRWRTGAMSQRCRWTAYTSFILSLFYNLFYTNYFEKNIFMYVHYFCD